MSGSTRTGPAPRLADLSREERARLFERLRSRPGPQASGEAIPRLAERPDPLPLSFAQQRLWLLDRLYPGDPSYNLLYVLEITGPLVPTALRRALEAVADRHESLRTTFAERDGRAAQVVAPSLAVPLPLVDLTALGEEARRAEVERIGGEDAGRPFDLAAGPLLRALLLKLAPERHAIVLDMHHIVSDGWSQGVMVAELAALYEAAASGRPAGLPELPIQYADFAVWQRAWLSGERLEEQLAFWRGRLAGIEPLRLPTDRPRPPRRGSAGAARAVAVVPAVAERLQAFALAERATPFIVLLAAFQALLGRLADQDDAAVGSAVANRNRSETAGLIGFFVNTLVLRGDLSGDPSFRELVGRLREVSLQAWAHQDLPFEMLVEELRPERDPSRTPLFQAFCVLQNAPRPALATGSLTIRALETPHATAKFDLNLGLVEMPDGGGLHGDLEYSTELFEGATATRFARQFETLLAAALAAPDRRLSELPLLTPAALHQVVAEWNDAAVGRPRGATLHALVEARIDRAPEATALRWDDGSLTYGELEEAANRLARHLRALGVGPESRVGVCLERSPEMVVSLLAVLKAGGAWVPLDPESPPERLTLLLADAGLSFVLTADRHAPALAGAGARLVALDDPEVRARLAAEPAARPEGGATTAGAAYVIFTSGSTGRPKGVVNTHAGIVNRLLWMQEAYGLGPSDRVLQKTPFGFDVSVWEFFWPLIEGARLVIARPGGHQDPSYLARTIAAEGVTTLHFVPSMLQAFLDAPDLGPLPSLRRVIASGEALTPELRRRFLAALPGVELHNLYGPTEAAVDVTAWDCRGDAGGRVPIGRPVANVRIHLLDRAARPVPVGVAGELCIGGVQVARGYQGRPDLTAERFVPDPVGGVPGERLYRTGDLARLLPDGLVEYLGRLDFQVKVRGVRVEPGEIEAALSALPGVREAAVVLREDRPGDRRLVAYVTPADLAAGGLREGLQRRLPGPLMPSAFVPLAELPLNASGKVDRRALAGPAFRPEPAEGDGTVEEPRTDLERAVAEVWREILGVERVGRGSNFFDLGGHSLLATQAAARLRDRLGIEVPMSLLFDHPVLAAQARILEEQLAPPVPVPAPAAPARAVGELSREEKVRLFARLRERREGSGRAAAERIPRRPPDLDPVPLSYAQERLWFLDRLEPGLAAYNMPFPLSIRGELSPAALEAALGGLVARHESLRTRFAQRGGAPAQIVDPPAPWRLPEVDLAGLPDGVREDEARRLYRREALRPFDLGRGSLMRTVLVRLAPREHALVLAFHHIVSDGWSMGVMLQDLVALYGAAVRGVPSPLPPLPIQYADFAVWQRGWLTGAELARQTEYWRARLEGAPASIDLPADRPRPAAQSFRGARHELALDPRRTAALAALARRGEGTTFMVLLAATAALLRRWTGQDDLPVGTPIANRNRDEVGGLIGFFVNTLVMRCDAAGDPTFRELLARVRGTALAAYQHQDLPFERLVAELRPARHLSHNPLFQVMFAVQNAPPGRAALGDLSLGPVDFEFAEAHFDLEITWTEHGDRLLGELVRAVDLFDAATVDRLGVHLLNLLAAVAEQPDLRLSALPLLGAAERHQLLAEWNDAPAAGEPLDVPARFAAAVRRSPDATAVAAGEERLTFAELDRRAGLVARRLRGLGARAETRVALCLGRTVDLPAAILGIWRAGAAYVPLDPALPPARLAYLLDDSRAEIAVVSAETAAALPEHELPTVTAGGWEEGDGELGVQASPGSLAYMIYTSGTTGLPKAVCVERRHLAATLAAVAGFFAPGDRLPCVAPFSFDIFLFELLGPLLAGGTVELVPLRPVLDVERLAAKLTVEGGATLLHAVPALMRQVVEQVRVQGSQRSLRGLFVGGDAVPADLLAEMREAFPGAWVRVLYGPTEATIVCSSHLVPAEGTEGEPRPLLGRPLPGAVLELRDRDGNLVTAGAVGEVWIGGSAVARGYWRRDGLTGEKFVTLDGRRYLRSGDLARRLPDGTLEFLGRLDDQVKVRGFRIELGEVEAALARHPQVREAVATARDDDGSGRRLVAYLVPRPAAEADPAAAAGDAAEHVGQWRALYDETYGRAAAPDPTFDVEGWNSSYTGEPIPAAEMREWVEATVRRVRSLGRRRILEVGSGTGLLLFRLAPGAERYRGTDFSAAAVDHVGRHLAALGLGDVELARAEAADWTGVAPGDFDLVVLNSVAQYFPGVDYLVRVLAGAAAAVAPGGEVFVGDVRSRPLLPAFHAGVELAQAPADLPAEELRRRAARRTAAEEELVVDPALFAALARRLPGVRRADVLVKRGRAANELTRYRYDAVLHVGPDAAPTPAVDWTDWGRAGLTLAALDVLLAGDGEGGEGELALSGIPDARVAFEAAAQELLAGGGVATAGELRRAAAERAEGSGAVDPEALAALAESRGWSADLLVDPAPGRFAAVFRRGSGVSGPLPTLVEAAADLPWSAWANDPLRAQQVRRLLPELRRALQAELPEYMVPSAFVVLDALPLTAHGKVDRAALPAPDPDRSGLAAAYEAPRTPLESALAGLWSELLGVERAGLADDFFALGGHSLLATQLVSRLRDLAGVELPVRAVFEEPTLGGLAARVERERGGNAAFGGKPPLVPVPRTEAMPLSFAQERMWFLNRLEPGSSAYHIHAALRLRGALRPDVLAETLRRLVARHETLRTTFPAPQGRPVQRIAPPPASVLAEIDLRGLPEGLRAAEAARLAAEQAARPFDLVAGPVLRAALVRLDERASDLLFTLHHIVSDGWSMGVLVGEVAALYGAIARGEEPALPPLSVQYADFAVWQREWLHGAALDAELGFWKVRLAGEIPALRLPTDRPRPPVWTGHGGARSLALPPELVAGVEELARGSGSTLFMAALAAFQTLLGRWSGQTDQWTGSPVANRNRSELEGLIGFFVNTLVLRTRLDDDPPFRALLGRVREATLEAYGHQDLPFERLVAELQPERDPSRAPLFQALFVLQNAPAGALDLPGVTLEPLPGADEGGATPFDVLLSLWPAADGGLVAAFQYARDLFDAATVERLAGHFRNLLAGIVGSPEARLSDLPLLSPAEAGQLLKWGRGAEGDGRPATLHGLVREQAGRTPGATALIAGREHLSYAELWRRAERLAGQLRALGVGPETGVALFLPRSADLVAAMLGTLAAGGFYVPLDPAYPEERNRLLLEDSGAAVLLTTGALAERTPAGAARVALVEGEGTEAPGPEPEPGNLAYLIYTSGSTGRPKGVAIAHRSAVRRIRWAASAFSPAELSRVLAATSIAFDLSVFELFAPLASGGAAVLADDALALPGLPAASEVTLVNTVPSALAELLRGPGLPASVRTVNLAGEALPRALADRVLALGLALNNLYGPSEDTTYSTWERVEGGDPSRGQSPPIGRPLDGTRAHVLDGALRPAPLGVPGELCLGGDGLARGYLGRPELTAERFVPDPFAAAPGARLYRTGDLARFLPTGALEYLGRIDQQVKLRGFRIELGEVEATLATLPGVCEAAALVREDRPGDRRLVAWVAPEGLDADSLREALRRRLPEPYVPSFVVPVAALPLTPSGKVDRRALAGPSWAPEGPGADPAEAPRTPLEREVAAVWSEVLGVEPERVGVGQSFFALGGHSLLAAQALARLSDRTGIELPLSDLFGDPTVAGVARRLEEARPPQAALTREERARLFERLRQRRRGGGGGDGEGDGGAPLSFAQQRIWFLSRIAPGSPAYNIPSALRLRGALDVAALAAALGEIVRRHDALRTRFVIRGDQPVQVVAPAVDVPLPLADLSGLGGPAREAEAARLMREEAAAPFDLAALPLLRLRLLRLAPGEHLLLVNLHHVAGDAWSLTVILRELVALYPAFRAGRPSPLPELPLQYPEHARRQREALSGEALEREIALWRRALAGARALELPTDRPRPAVTSFAGAARTEVLPPELAARARELALRSRSTPFMVLLAPFAALLSRLAGTADVVAGTTVSGRVRPEIEGLVGFFVNTLVLRLDLAGDPDGKELLARARHTALFAFSHQELPFEKLVDELGLPRDPYRSPLLRAVIQLHNAAAPGAGLDGLELIPEGQALEAAKLDLLANFAEVPGSLMMEWRWDTDLFDAATVIRFRRAFVSLLRALLDDPGRRLSELPLLDAAERHQLAVEWNPAVEPARDRDAVHRLFEAAVDRHPERPALTADGATLSYAELDARANRLARHLLAAGARPGELVGLCLERSAELVVAILAALKAGAAYLPLDPAHPAERLAFALEDAGARLLVAHRGLADALPVGERRLIDLDAEAAEIAARSPERIAPQSAPTDAEMPAYVIYTSGSTGRPKGVVIPHGHVARLFSATEPWFGFGPDDVWTLFHSYAFDFSVWEVWGALLHGGRLVVVPYWESRSPEAFYALLRAERVTVLSQTPSAFRQLLWAEESALGGAPPDLALRLVVFGGEALEPAALAPWIARHGDERPRLVNMYGITETTVHVTYRPIRAADAADAAAGRGSAVGEPIPDLSLHVVDGSLTPQPIGVPGEIAVGGAGVALGYLRRPELTAERFVPDPFGPPGARLYRSGDLARRLPDGDVEYLGRIDQQVKVRGHRIELGEVEAALARHPAVREAVAGVRPGPGGEPWLVAWVAAGPEAPGLPELRELLSASLPEPMLPSALVVLDWLPLTPNGKVDRRALPDPGAAPAAADAEPPATDLERTLADLFRGVLQLPPDRPMGRHEDFFALGGNSITAAILANRLQEELGGIVHVVVVFDAPSIAALAAYLEEQHPDAAARLGGQARAERRQERRIEIADLETLRSLVEAGRSAAPAAGEPRNPPAVFLLSPPRSGSTLLRVMLGAHPRLFAPPELELLSFATLAERRAAFQGRDAFWLEGAVRAVMEALGCGAGEAERLIAERERLGWSTLRFYRELQEWIGGRLLVDKTPSYAVDPAVLRRAEEGFAGARYIHLLRHPAAVRRSFEEAKLDQLVFRREHPFTRRQLGELLWTASHENVLAFLAGVPAGRRFTVRFEELVREPARVLSDICGFLGIDFRPEMADPYLPGAARMVDGPHAVSRALGDVKLLAHGRVDAAAAERWREEGAGTPLGEPTLALAAELGYSSPEGGPDGGSVVAPLSFSQERLWFLDRLTPGTSIYNIPSPLTLRGPLDVGVLARAFDEIRRRQGSMRTRFEERGGEGVQVVDPPSPQPLALVDLSGLPADRRAPEAARLTGEEAAWPFELERGPLVRTTLLRLAPEEHGLLVTMHHIVSDGWSVRVFHKELTALYAAFASGRPSPLPELPAQYTDFSRWQRQRLAGGEMARQIAYWRERLGGDPPVLDLPLDRPRPPIQTFRGAGAQRLLPAALADALRRQALAARGSLFMALLAGFDALLGRLSGQEEVLVGTPVAGRVRSDVEELIGFFLNTLVVRADLSGNPSFRALLERVRTAAVGAYAHQEVSFEKLLEELKPERDLSRTPLFQVFFNLANFPDMGARLPGGLAVEALEGAGADSKFDLTVYASEIPDGVLLNLVYNADLFDAPRMEEMLRQYQRLLEQAVERPEVPLADLSLLTGEARALLPDPRLPLSGEWRGAVHDLFLEQARRAPERTALVDDDGEWAYGELAAAVECLAAALQASGLAAGDRVAVWAHRSAPVAWAVLGTLRAGGAFVMLDPAYPPSRIAEMLELAAPRAWVALEAAGPPPAEVDALLAERALPRFLLPTGGPARAREAAAGWPEAAAPVAVGPDDPALVAFTSGSTGRPKGIVGRHGPLSHFLPWQRERFGLSEHDRYSLLSGLAHDPLQRDVFTPLCTGAALCAPRLEEVATPGRLAAWMARQRITVAHLTPAMAQILTEPPGGGAPPAMAAMAATVPSLRWVLLVGDVLTRRDVERLRALAPAVRVVNLYGSTETQRAVAWHEVRETGERLRQILPLGRGMEDVQLLVVNTAASAPQLAGVGEVGEIWMRSPHLAAGYLGDPALTAERFPPNPFTAGTEGSDRADRVYRTGDLGRYLPDGDATFAGRADLQVKIRGFRIELGEIEAALGRLPGVREAVVVARQDGADAERRLVAYVVGDPGNPPAVEALRDELRRRLPAYMVPAAFVTLDRLPVTPNNKVDRRALPAPEMGAGEAFVEPQSDLERTIAAVWGEVLGLERVSATGNFFDLGGHSLLLVRLHARLQEAVGRELTLVELFNYPNVRALAEHLGRQMQPAAAPAAAEQPKERAQKQIDAARRAKELARARRGGPARPGGGGEDA